MALDTYIIQEGDTLSVLAKRFNLPVEALAKANNIKDVNRIRAGKTLVIPVIGKQDTPATVKEPPHGTLLEVVKKFSDEQPRPLKKDIVKIPVEVATVAKPATVAGDKLSTQPDIPWYQKVATAIQFANENPEEALSSSLSKIATRFGMSQAEADKMGRDVTTMASLGLITMPGLRMASAPEAVAARPARFAQPQAGAARDFASEYTATARPKVNPNAPIQPTSQQLHKLQVALRNRPAGFDPGIDTNYGMPNVREPGPALGDPAQMSSEPPLGAKEVSLDVGSPTVLRASDMDHRDLVGTILRGGPDKTYVIDHAHDLGFMSDRVMVVPGTGDTRVDPEAVLNSHETPVLTQSMLAKVLKFGNSTIAKKS